MSRLPIEYDRTYTAWILPYLSLMLLVINFLYYISNYFK